jgi:hypothetical protein
MKTTSGTLLGGLEPPEWLYSDVSGSQSSASAACNTLSHSTLLSAESVVSGTENDGSVVGREPCARSEQALLEARAWRELCNTIAELPAEDRFEEAAVDGWTSMVAVDDDSLQLAMRAVSNELSWKCQQQQRPGERHETLASVARKQLQRGDTAGTVPSELVELDLRTTTRNMVARSAALAAASLATARRSILQQHAERVKEGLLRSVWVAALQQNAAIGLESSVVAHTDPPLPAAPAGTVPRTAAPPPSRSELVFEEESAAAGGTRLAASLRLDSLIRHAAPPPATLPDPTASSSPASPTIELPVVAIPPPDVPPPVALGSGMVFLSRGDRSAETTPSRPRPQLPGDEETLPTVPASLPIAIPKALSAQRRNQHR